MTGLLTLLLALTPVVWGANLLVVVPMPARSHQNLFDPIAQELARRGHQVTYISPFKLKNPEKNVKQILVPPIEPDPNEPPKNFFEMRHFTPAHNVVFLPIMVEQMSKHMMSSPQIKSLLQENHHFDAIIVEAFLTEGIAAGLAHKYKAPLIGYATFMPSHWVNYMVGNEAPSSYIPDPFLSLPTKMNFYHRFLSATFNVLANFYHGVFHIRAQDKLMREYFGQDLPCVKEIIANTSILLVNDHYSISFPRPAVPNLISIGGVHVSAPKPLPADLQKYLDNSKKGAIFFSFGSNLKSAMLGEERIQIFLNVFAKLEQNVLWKFEAELPNKPKNVLISDWFPQADVLAHPNLKLFITHGGLLSTTESVQRAVPLVGIPVFGDQPMNMKQSVNAGVGLSIDFDDLTEEGLLNAIKEVLNNPKYAKAAKERSKAFQDVPIGPLETAMWWIEYVIRNKGAPQLRSAAQDLAWYQRDQLDVLAAVFITSFVVICITKKLLKKILSLCKSKKTQNADKKKKKN